MKNRIIISAGGIFIIAAVIIYVWKTIGPTRILFVNFRDWQVAEYIDANMNRFISIERCSVKELSLRNLKRFDIVFIFGMGLRLSEKQRSMLENAVDAGVPLLLYATTSDEDDLTNLPLDQVPVIRDYLSYGGNDNIDALFNYIRKEVDGKKKFTQTPCKPRKCPDNLFLHPDASDWFAACDEYQKWYSKAASYSQDGKRVLILTSNTSMSNKVSGRPYIALIRALEKRGFNVYTTSGFGKRLDHIRQVEPSIVVFFAHGRLAPGMSDSAINLLEKKNIPVLAPLIVHQLIDEWDTKQIGMSGGMLGQSIVAPEIDGATTPFVIGGLSVNEKGYQVFAEIPERVERFASMVSNYVALSEKENKNKKVAVVYFKGPGKNALTASGLEVTSSMLNVLRYFKEQGYTTGPLPDDERALDSIIQRYGPLPGAYARGSIEEFMNTEGIITVNGDTLLSWMKESLRPELVDAVREKYGPSPGQYLVNTDSSGVQQIAVPAVRFGNIVLLSQLMPALGDDEFQLVHGVKRPPPYPYIATYLWARNEFNTDALIHFGTHGSLEFTPWKQSALSSLDWPDALVGDVPHFYLYTINNIGEAVIAKRRSYADMISHITPPFRRGDLYAGLRYLHNLIDQYEAGKNTALRAQLWKLIRKKALEEKIDIDLNLPELRTSDLDSTSYSKIHRYLHAVESEKITDGLYTIGIPYTQDQVKTTIVEMFGERLAHSLARLDLINGIITKETIDNPHEFERLYLADSRNIIAAISSGEYKGKLIEDSVMAAYQKVKDILDKDEPVDIMGAMVSFMGDERTAADDSAMTEDDLHDCLGSVMADEKLKAQLLKLNDEKALKRMRALMNPGSYKQAQRMAKIVPAMKDALEFYDHPCSRQLIVHMQNRKRRNDVFKLTKEDKLKKIIQTEKVRKTDSTISFFGGDSVVSMLRIANEPGLFNNYLEKASCQRVEWVVETLKEFLKLPESILKKFEFNKYLADIGCSSEGKKSVSKSLEAAESVLMKIKNKEREFAESVKDITVMEETVHSKVKVLKNSGSIELASITNALNGGYIKPSTGGDAVYNPDAVPTGRNIYGINAENTPGEGAWNAGVALAKEMLAFEMEKRGKLPCKVAFTLWGGEFIRDQGTTIAQILYLLGVEPLRSSTGRVHDVRLIPMEKLGRPRIDVVVQTSGQFRDIAASRLFLIDRAVSLAASADDNGQKNFVSEGASAAEKHLKENGFSPVEARKLSTARVFGGVNGNYGTGIMGLVESGDKYESDTTIANLYLNNMGAVYTREYWGEINAGLFEAALINTDVIMHSRSSNTTGPLSLDHVYEFMGGLNTAVKKITGKDPQGLFVDIRNPDNKQIVDAHEAVWTEARSTVLNPNYIRPLLKGGKSSAEVFAETVRNTFGWNATKESIIDEELWDKYHEVLVKDTFNLGMQEFFEKINPYAFQEITAVMLESVRKGMWQPDSAVIRSLADKHVTLVEEHEAGCSGFVCNNDKLAAMISSIITPQKAESYKRKLGKIRDGVSKSTENAVTLKKEKIMETVKRVAMNNGFLLIAIAVIIAAIAFPFFRKRSESL